MVKPVLTWLADPLHGRLGADGGGLSDFANSIRPFDQMVRLPSYAAFGLPTLASWLNMN